MDRIVLRASKDELPPNARLLTRSEALTHMYETIYAHQPLSDVFTLRYGGAIVGVFASLSGIVMLRHFRTALGLRKEAFISSALTCTFLPCIGSFVYHFMFVTPKIVLEEPVCPLCLELRASSIQTFSGFVLPYGMAMVSASMTARHIGSNVPTLLNPIRFAQLSFSLARIYNGPIKFGGLFILNMLGAILLINAEQIQLLQFKRRVAVREVLED